MTIVLIHYAPEDEDSGCIGMNDRRLEVAECASRIEEAIYLNLILATLPRLYVHTCNVGFGGWYDGTVS